MQKILTLIITAGILYMLLQYNLDNTPTPQPRTVDEKIEEKKPNDSTPEVSGGFIEKTLSGVLINVLKTEEGRNFLENLVTPLDQPIAGSGNGYKMNNDMLVNNMLQIKTFGEGKGGSASCGHLVTVKYKVMSLNNMVLSEKIETFPLGSKTDIPGLDAVIVGMKIGQTRQATIPFKLVDLNQTTSKNSHKITVELREILPKNFADETVQIFDDEIAYSLPLLCGQKVIYDAKITKLSDGTILYNSKEEGKKISMNIGDQIYPVIFSHALHNKIPVGKRTVIAKGSLFKSFMAPQSKIFNEFGLNDSEYYMLELINIKRPEGIITPSSEQRQMPKLNIQ